MKKKKITVAGMLVQEAVYSVPAGRESAKVRAAKRKASSEAQQRMNAKYSWQKLELMLAANLLPGDLVVTLTFDDEHLPPDRKTAAARLKKFRQAMAARRREAGQDLRMIWTLENKSDAGRWHVHLALNSTCDGDYQDVLQCWPYGRDTEIRKLQVDRQKNYETLARYMCKEARERPGLRSWSYTRSCRHPETETFTVPDDTDVLAPEGATVLLDASLRTDYGSFHYVKYLAAEPVKLKRKGVRRKRKR